MREKKCGKRVILKKQPTVHGIRVKHLLLGFLLLFCGLITPGVGEAQQSLLWRDLFSVSFPTENDGWVCGRRGIVAQSVDGGETWSRQDSGTAYTLAGITFIDERVGWAVGDAGTILHTTDGGSTWIAQKSPVKHYLTDVHFVDDRQGWITTARSSILSTKDGGENWEVQFTETDEDLTLRTITFYDAKNGWAGGEYGYIYRTTDGGATWDKQAGFVRISWETELLETGNFIFDMKALAPQTCWAVGQGKYAAKTTDGGKTWQEVKLDMIPEDHLLAVATNNAGDVFIGGNGFIVASSDGGKTFKNTVADPTIIYGWIGDITQRGQNGFIAVGIKAWIYGLSERSDGAWKMASYTKSK